MQKAAKVRNDRQRIDKAIPPDPIADCGMRIGLVIDVNVLIWCKRLAYGAPVRISEIRNPKSSDWTAAEFCKERCQGLDHALVSHAIGRNQPIPMLYVRQVIGYRIPKQVAE